MDSSKSITDNKVQASLSPPGMSAPYSKGEDSALARSPNGDNNRLQHPSAMSALSSSPTPGRDRSTSRSSETWSPRATTPSRERGSIVQGMISKFQHENTLSATSPQQPLRQRTQRSTSSIQQSGPTSPIAGTLSIAQQQTLSPARSTHDLQLRTPRSTGEEGLTVHRSQRDHERSPLSHPSNSYSAVSAASGGSGTKPSTPLSQSKGHDVSPLELFPSLGALDAAGLLASSKADTDGALLSDLQLHTLTPIEPVSKSSFAEGVRFEDMPDNSADPKGSKNSKSKLALGWKKLRKSIRPNGGSQAGSKRDTEGPSQQTLSCVTVERQASLGDSAAIPERKAMSDLTSQRSVNALGTVQALGSDFGPEFSLTLESLGSAFGSGELQDALPEEQPPFSSSTASTAVPPLSSSSNASTMDLLSSSKTVAKTPAIVTTPPEDNVVFEGGINFVDIVDNLDRMSQLNNDAPVHQKQPAPSTRDVSKPVTVQNPSPVTKIDARHSQEPTSTVDTSATTASATPVAKETTWTSAEAESTIPSRAEPSDRSANVEANIRVQVPHPPKVSVKSVDQDMLPTPLSPPENDPLEDRGPQLAVAEESHEFQADISSPVGSRSPPPLPPSRRRLEELTKSPTGHEEDPMPTPTRRANSAQPSGEKQRWRLSAEGMPRVYGTIGSKTGRHEVPTDERPLQTGAADLITEEEEATDEQEAEAKDCCDNAFKVSLAQSVQLASAMFGNGKRIPLSLYYVTEELRARDLTRDIQELFPLSWEEADPELEKLLVVFDNRPFGQGYDLSEIKPVVNEGGDAEQAEEDSEEAQAGVSSRQLSCVILWFLKQLPESVLSSEILGSLSSIARLQSTDEVKSKAAAALVQALPQDNLHLLQFLFEFVDLALLQPIQEEIQQSRETLTRILEDALQQAKSPSDQPDVTEARLHDLQSFITEKQQQLNGLRARIAHTLTQVIGRADLSVDNDSQPTDGTAQVMELFIRHRHEILGPASFAPSEDGGEAEHEGGVHPSHKGSTDASESDQSTVVMLEEDDRGYHSDTMINKVAKSARKNQRRILRSLRLRLTPHGDGTAWELDERGNFVLKKLEDPLVVQARLHQSSCADLATLRAIHERMRQMHQLSNKHQRRNSAATVHSVVADAHSVADLEEEDRVAAIERTNQGLADALNGRQETPAAQARSPPRFGGSSVLQRLGFKDILQEPLERKQEKKELKAVEKEILQSEAISRHLVSSLSGLYPSTSHTPVPLSVLPSARKQIQLNAAMAAASYTAVSHLLKSIPPPAEQLYANPEDNKDPRVRPAIEKVWKPQEPIVIPPDHQESNSACSCTYCRFVAKPSRIDLPSRQDNEVTELRAEVEAKELHVTELLKTVHDLQGQVNVLNAKLLFLHDHHTTRPMRRRALTRRSQTAPGQQQSQQHQISTVSTESSEERRFRQLHLNLKEARRGSINSQGSSVSDLHGGVGTNPYSPQNSDVTMHHRTGTPGSAPNLPTPQSLLASPPGFATPSSLLRAFPDGVPLANNNLTNQTQHFHASTSNLVANAKDQALRHHRSLPLFAGPMPPHHPSTSSSTPGTDMDVPEFVLDEDDTMSHLDLDQDYQYFSQQNGAGRPVTPSTRSSTVVSFGNPSFGMLPHGSSSSSTPFRVESELELVLRDMEEAEEAEVYVREGEDQVDEYYYADAYRTMDQRLYRRPTLPVPQAPPPMSAEQYKKHQRMSIPIQSMMSRRINLANTFKWKSSRAALA